MFLGAVVMTFERQVDQDEVRSVSDSVESLMDLLMKGLESRDLSRSP